MAYQYIIHTNGAIGVADIPDWLNFEEQPPRSFRVRWVYPNQFSSSTTTMHTRPTTKEVVDIMMGV
jgi:hypothetical protein